MFEGERGIRKSPVPGRPPQSGTCHPEPTEARHSLKLKPGRVKHLRWGVNNVTVSHSKHLQLRGAFCGRTTQLDPRGFRVDTY